ncbi:MAG: hypothetical protein H6652_02380 [Ardenticatenaceae bacterium]|nr:hypothetical protein [Ardenticatenaceae bacterium]
MKKTILILTLSVFFLLSACGPNASDTSDTAVSLDTGAETSSDSAYPVPTKTTSGSYPPPQANVSGYPAPTVVDESKRFAINEPIEAGSNDISGTGPANTPIKVISISYVGDSLGNGVIEEDGTFHISLSSPLEANHVIGLQLGDQSLEASFQDGPGYTNIPMIGLILAQAVVQP